MDLAFFVVPQEESKRNKFRGNVFLDVKTERNTCCFDLSKRSLTVGHQKTPYPKPDMVFFVSAPVMTTSRAGGLR